MLGMQDKLGLKEAQIRQNAVQAGWPLATVNQALKYLQNDTTEEAPVSSNGTALSSTTNNNPTTTGSCKGGEFRATVRRYAD